jgi:hypothetical protein
MYKLIFFKMGFTIGKCNLIINKNYLINDVGKILKKDDVEINILHENKLLFCSDTKSAFEYLISFKLVPHIIFGECNIINDKATIKYRIPVFLIFSIVTMFLFFIYKYLYNLILIIPVIIFILSLLIVFSLLQYLKLNNIRNDIEYYILNGI